MLSLMRRVVVTGLGLISPVGNSISDAWDNVKAGRVGSDLLIFSMYRGSPVVLAVLLEILMFQQSCPLKKHVS